MGQPVISTVKKLSDKDIIIAVSHGRDTLRMSYEDGADDLLLRSALTLNGVPLVECRPNECPTCSGLLAAGYGRDSISADEIRAVSEGVNAGFESLERSVETIAPLLGLLETGLYMISDRLVFPTDGNGRFFWDVPPEMTEYPAYCDWFYDSEFATVTDLQGAFIYPTQSPDKYDESRVLEYMERFGSGKDIPRAVAMYALGGMSALLDGHHKACAAARLRIPLNCIMITPCVQFYDAKNEMNKLYFKSCLYSQQLVFDDGLILPDDVRDKYNDDFDRMKKRIRRMEGSAVITRPESSGYTVRRWEKCYTDSAGCYPTAREYSNMLASGAAEICSLPSDEIIDRLKTCREPLITVSSVLMQMKLTGDRRIKETATKFARHKICPETKPMILTAIKTLLDIDDEETEQLFVELAVCDDRDIAEAALERW